MGEILEQYLNTSTSSNSCETPRSLSRSVSQGMPGGPRLDSMLQCVPCAQTLVVALERPSREIDGRNLTSLVPNESFYCDVSFKMFDY